MHVDTAAIYETGGPGRGSHRRDELAGHVERFAGCVGPATGFAKWLNVARDHPAAAGRVPPTPFTLVD